MDASGFIFTAGMVVAGGMYLWTFAEKGKEWPTGL